MFHLKIKNKNKMLVKTIYTGFVTRVTRHNTTLCDKVYRYHK